jgi:hypothetical protein
VDGWFDKGGNWMGYAALASLKEGQGPAGYVFYPNREVLTTSVAVMKNELGKKFLKNS